MNFDINMLSNMMAMMNNGKVKTAENTQSSSMSSLMPMLMSMMSGGNMTSGVNPFAGMQTPQTPPPQQPPQEQPPQEQRNSNNQPPNYHKNNSNSSVETTTEEAKYGSAFARLNNLGSVNEYEFNGNQDNGSSNGTQQRNSGNFNANASNSKSGGNSLTDMMPMLMNMMTQKNGFMGANKVAATASNSDKPKNTAAENNTNNQPSTSADNKSTNETFSKNSGNKKSDSEVKEPDRINQDTDSCAKCNEAYINGGVAPDSILQHERKKTQPLKSINDFSAVAFAGEGITSTLKRLNYYLKMSF